MSLQGRYLIVTAGPTIEPLDPVRFLSNHSSGKMGYAIAGALAARGAHVALVSGRTCLPTPAGTERIDVLSAEEMYRAVMERFPQADGEPFARIFGFAVVCHRRTSYFFLYSSARPRLPSGSKWPVRSSRLTVIPAIIGVTRAAAANSAAVKTGGSASGRNRP